MEDLLGKQLIIVAGKGGVGKTTTSSALALRLAKEGRKTLLVTVDPAKRLEDALGIKLGGKETPVQPNLSAMMLDPEVVIREHLQREVPQAKITEHPMFRYVTNYMPGLNELMAIGKLNDFRRAGKYDAIVVDTAPTGHALSFLSAPGAIKELMSEKSLIKWAIRGYTVWQKVYGTMKSAGNLFKKKDDKKHGPPDIDFESIFANIEEEAEKIQEFLRDPDHSAFIIVTLPEKLPVEETIDLHRAAIDDLGMQVNRIIVNKVQPDPFGDNAGEFSAIADDSKARETFVASAAKATKVSPAIIEAMVAGAEFGQIRRDMNLEHLEGLRSRLKIPLTLVPLFKQDVNGLGRLADFEAALWDQANRLE